ncbi:MAG: restriction endonuclease [Candidatus Saccharimonadales bacterium]
MRRSPIFFGVLAVTVVTYWEYFQYVVALIILLISVRTVLRITRFVRRLVANRKLRHVDVMNGIEFEEHIANVLKSQGYTNIQLTEQFDYGVDIVASKNGIRWGIQVKRYSGLVKADAVRQVVTGLKVYGCDRAMVITNSVFSRVAVRLAESNDCVLVDRVQLSRMGIALWR